MIQAIALVLDFAPAHWSPSTRMVAVALGDYVNTDSSYAWPSVANLARRSGISTRQVQRCLRQIERDGWIERATGDTHRLGTTLWMRALLPAGGKNEPYADEPEADRHVYQGI